MTSKEIQDYVWNWLRNKGLNEKAAAGIMGNISQESAWDVNSIEEGNSIGFGLCQWSFTRRTQLEAYGTDLDHQLEFLWSELTGNNLSATGADKQWINQNGYIYTSFISGAYSPSECASAFCWCWERPNASEANEAYRQSEAESFYTSYTGTGGGDTGGGDTGGGDSGGGSGTAGEVYTKLLTTPYNIKQLSDEQITFLKTLKFNDIVLMKFTYNHNKRQVGQNYLGNKLTFDKKGYIIKDVRNDGYIILTYGGNACYKYVNPKYITSNT